MDEKLLQKLLPTYYSNLFPYDDYYRWLRYEDEKTFANREFAFILPRGFMVRYKSFQNVDEFKTEIKRRKPLRVDIGPVYDNSPVLHKRDVQLKPVQKELIFDIDINDYDEVRSCCSENHMCTKCWKYMIVACKILDAAMREDFGFEHVLWVYSGRRGIHFWICDRTARFLSHDTRDAILCNLQLITGGKCATKKVNLGEKVPSSIKRAVKIIESVFVEICVQDQDMLGTEKQIQDFLRILANDLRDEVRNLFQQYSTSFDRWKAFVRYFEEQKKINFKWRRTPHLMEEIMIQYCYPRLDAQVTTGMNHLLKSPFSIHPKTGRICVPIDPENLDRFDPSTVPKITDNENRNLNSSLKFFENFVGNLGNQDL